MKQAGFDIIGDVHGYADKLVSLLNLMGIQNWTEPGGIPHDRQSLSVI